MCEGGLWVSGTSGVLLRYQEFKLPALQHKEQNGWSNLDQMTFDIAYDPNVFHINCVDIADDPMATKGTPRLKHFQKKMLVAPAPGTVALELLRLSAGHTSGAEKLVVWDSQHIPKTIKILVVASNKYDMGITATIAII